MISATPPEIQTSTGKDTQTQHISHLTEMAHARRSFSFSLTQRATSDFSKDSSYQCLRWLVVALTPDRGSRMRGVEGEMCFCLRGSQLSSFGFALKSSDGFSEQISARHSAPSWEVDQGKMGF